VVDGFADLVLRGCVFSGFEFAVQLSGGAKGLVEDCVFVKPGHCGLTAGRGAEVTARRNLVTGSLFHGMRCTGGTLNAEDNLIIANKNRGIYLGNRAAHGLLHNNVILGNATGISVFGGSDNIIRNNLLLDNTFAGLDARSLCPITVEANILQGNNQGFVVWEESAAPSTIRLGGNTFWRNASNDVLRIDMPAGSMRADAGFTDAAAGDFSRVGVSGPGADHGLVRPQALQPVWEKWTAVSRRVEPGAVSDSLPLIAP
jgi:parallel beta-helix repeat protein